MNTNTANQYNQINFINSNDSIEDKVNEVSAMVEDLHDFLYELSTEEQGCKVRLAAFLADAINSKLGDIQEVAMNIQTGFRSAH